MQNDYLKTFAFCLQKKPMGKQSVRLDLFSRDVGKICFYQKGFFQPKSLYPAQFDLGHELELLLGKQEQTYRIQEACVKTIYPLEGYEALTHASFVLELLLKIESDYSDHAPAIFLMLKKIFEGLGSGQTQYNPLLYFQYQLLLKAGLASHEFLCEHCGIEIDSSSPAYATTPEWCFTCPACIKKNGLINLFVFLPGHRIILEKWNDEHCLEKGLTHFFNRFEVPALQNFLNRIYQKDFALKSLDSFMDLLQQKSGKTMAL